jgi:outer membrane protein insertion porin family
MLQEDVPIVIKRIEFVFLEDKPRETTVGKWLDWLRRPNRTNISILEEVIETPLYGKHKDFRELWEKAQTVVDDLTKLGCHEMDKFDMDIDAFDETAKHVVGEPYEVVCRVSLKEKNLLNIGARLSAEGESAGGATELKMRNYFGRLEQISGDVSAAQGQTVFNLTMEKPIVKRPFGSKLMRFGVANSHEDNRALSSHTQKQVHCWASYIENDHSFTYEGAYRDVQLDRTATEEMLSEGGQSIKSSIRYTYQVDSRDNILMPTLGHRIRASAELAGLMGDVKHLKFEADFNRNWSLNQNMHFQFISRAGALFSFGQRSHIADRYFFGGLANPFFGFKLHGAGPRLVHDSYGGDAFWTSSIHANIPISSLPVGDLFAHAFTQTGNCVAQKDWKAIFSPNDANSPIRLTAGAGLALTTPFGLRFDATYAVPLSVGPNDQPQTFSFGASFSLG